MLQIRRDADLAEEPIGAEYGAELWIEELERDLALVAEIARQEYGRHSAATNLAFELVAAGERRVELGQRVHAVSASFCRSRLQPLRAVDRPPAPKSPANMCVGGRESESVRIAGDTNDGSRIRDHFMPIPCGRAGPVANAVLKSIS